MSNTRGTNDEYFLDITCTIPGLNAMGEEAIERFVILGAKIAGGIAVTWFSLQELVHEIQRLRIRGGS